MGGIRDKGEAIDGFCSLLRYFGGCLDSIRFFCLQDSQNIILFVEGRINELGVYVKLGINVISSIQKEQKHSEIMYITRISAIFNNGRNDIYAFPQLVDTPNSDFEAAMRCYKVSLQLSQELGEKRFISTCLSCMRRHRSMNTKNESTN